MRSKGSQNDDKLVQDFLLAALHSEQLVYTNHKGTDTCVVRELLDVSCHFLNQFMEGFQFFLGGRFIRYQIIVVAVVEQ